MLRRTVFVIVLFLAGLLNAACWPPPFSSTGYVQTFIKEEDQLHGISTFVDPNRGYLGQRTTNLEKYGHTTVSGTTNSQGWNVRYNVSVPNRWTFINQDGVCAGEETFNERWVQDGTAKLTCEVFTGYNYSEYSPRRLSGDTVDGDDWYVPNPVNLNKYLLTANQQIRRHEALRAGGQMHQLILLDDGNLVLFYNGNDMLWQSGTDGSGATRLLMQGDGNLVLYNSSGSPVWSTGTADNPGAYLNVQDDGNLVVYSPSDEPLWARD